MGQETIFLLEACESYGRLILHREASLLIKDSNPRLSETVVLYLDWADSVVRAGATIKTQKISLPFNDPDLSCIKVDPSFIASPQTSTVADSSRTGVSQCSWDLPVIVDTLIASSCILISEWLAVGGPGEDEFSRKACGWCRLAPFDTLLLPYCRLAIQLARQSSSTCLLKSIFDHYKEELDESQAEIVRNTISCVLSSWAKPETIESVVKEVLSAALASLGEFRFDAASDTACCANAIWPFENGAVKAAIAAILRSVKGSKKLVDQLSSQIASCSDERQLRFLVHFLGMLSRLGSKACQEAATAMKDLDRERLSEQVGDMRDEFVDQDENATG